MATKKKSKKTARKLSNSALFHKLILEDDNVRQKLYKKFGRVRCYLYKTGRTVPNEDTAKVIEKLTGGKVKATGWSKAA